MLSKFIPQDTVLADRGFNIQELLLPYQVNLVIPPFLKKKQEDLLSYWLPTLKEDCSKAFVTGIGLDGDFFDVVELKHWVLNDKLLNCSKSFIMLLLPR